MVAKAFFFCLAQLALSVTIIMFQKRDFMNPDEGMSALVIFIQRYLKMPVISTLQRSVFIRSQRQTSLPLKFLLMQ